MKAARDQLLSNNDPLRPLSHQDERHQDKMHQLLYKQVDRQKKVGQSLQRLKIARRDLDASLAASKEFNYRILNPDEWTKELRRRQKIEMAEL